MKSEDYCFLAGKLWQTYKVCWEVETWLPTKACMVTVVSPVITYGCESWTVKEAECQKNWWLRAVVLQKTPECPLYSKEIKPVNIKGDQLWTLVGRTAAEAWSSSILATKCEELIHWKSLWCWERLRAEEEGIRGWDGWMASLTQWIWVWVNSGSWWWTGRPGVLRFMGLQRVGHNWATELNWE